jgi:hypothetical protein
MKSIRMRESPFSRSRPFGMPNLSPSAEEGGGSSESSPYEKNVPLYLQMVVKRKEIGHQYSLQQNLQTRRSQKNISFPLPVFEESLLKNEARYEVLVEEIPPAVQTAHMAFLVYQPIFQQMIDFYNHKDDGGFAQMFDVADGFHKTVSSVIQAEKQKHLDKQQVRDEYTKRAKELSSELTGNTVQEQELENVTKAIIQEGKRAQYLFEKNPSGVALITDRVTRIEEEQSSPPTEQSTEGIRLIKPYQTGELVLAGARLGKQTYTYMYTLVREALLHSQYKNSSV